MFFFPSNRVVVSQTLPPSLSFSLSQIKLPLGSNLETEKKKHGSLCLQGGRGEQLAGQWYSLLGSSGSGQVWGFSVGTPLPLDTYIHRYTFCPVWIGFLDALEPCGRLGSTPGFKNNCPCLVVLAGGGVWFRAWLGFFLLCSCLS